MSGQFVFRKIQLGKEANAGTPVAASMIWRGTGVPDDQRSIVRPPEHVGYAVRSNRTYTPMLLAGLSMDAIPATFEQLPYLLEAGIKTVNTGAADGSGSGKIYDYVFPSTAANTIKTFTIEGGDDQQAEEMEYAFVEKLTLAGKGQEAVTMQADWLARQMALSTFTGALTPPTVVEALAGNAKLYIDASGGTIGSTLKSNTLLEWTLELVTGWVPRWTAEGALVFGRVAWVGSVMDASLKITFEHDATSVAEKAAWRAETGRLLRLNVDGPALTTAGTAYQKKTLRIDLAGKWLSFDKLDEDEGNDIVEGEFSAHYSPSDSLHGRIIVVNEISVLP